MNSAELLTKGRLAAAFADAFPERQHLRVTALEKLPGGWETDTYAVALAFEQDRAEQQADYALRMFYPPEGRGRAQQQFELLQRLTDEGIRVPVAEGVLDVGPDLYALASRRVDGRPLDELLSTLAQAEHKPWLARMAQTLLALHRLDAGRVLGEGAMRPGDDYVQDQVAGLRETRERHGLDEFEPLLARLEAAAPHVSVQPLAVLHNDYHPGNILVLAGSDELVTIDWSFAGLGDPRLDLAWTGLMLQVTLGEGAREVFLASYAKGGGVVQNLEFFEILKFTQRMLTIANWLQPNTVIPVHKITREAIRGEYKVHVLNVYRRLLQLGSPPLPTIEAL